MLCLSNQNNVYNITKKSKSCIFVKIQSCIHLPILISSNKMMNSCWRDLYACSGCYIEISSGIILDISIIKIILVCCWHTQLQRSILQVQENTNVIDIMIVFINHYLRCTSGWDVQHPSGARACGVEVALFPHIGWNEQIIWKRGEYHYWNYNNIISDLFCMRKGKPHSKTIIRSVVKYIFV